MSRVNVMHMTDTLDAGGAERVAVNLANLLPRERYHTHLCTTRADGPLADLVAPDVGRLRLKRRRTLDAKALRRLVAYIRANDIQILHAHGSALLMANLASIFPPFPHIVWHDHFGRYAVEERPVSQYRLLTRRVRAVLTVNQPLLEWSRDRLRVAPERVWYLPNFASVAASDSDDSPPPLPGRPGARIVCVANLRPEKDHLTLLRAMALVKEIRPEAHLLLVGAESDTAQAGLIRQEIEQQNLAHEVSLLGQRRDVGAVLRACDIGVLSSASEGLPLSLLEYGMASLPVVATNVGQCADVLDQGRAGFVVEPRAPRQLADVLLELLDSSELRAEFAQRFQHRVQKNYSPDSALEQVNRVYDSILHPPPDARTQGVPEPAGPKLANFDQTPKRSVLMVGNFLSSTFGSRGVCEDLAVRLADSGWSVSTTSTKLGRISRLMDMLSAVWRRRHDYAVAQVDVYSGLSFFWAEAVCGALRLAGKPYILTLHGGDLPTFARRWPVRVRRLLRSAAAVTAPSRYLLEKLAPYGSGIRLQPNPLELCHYKFHLRARPQPRLVWLRAFHELYNPSLAPQVVALLESEFPDIELLMIGPDKGDESLQRVQQVAKELGVVERLILPGGVPKADVSMWLNRGDIFLNTTSVDNTPVSVLEAMACGLCVVSTNVGGMSYLLDDESDALLVPPNDAPQMAAAVRRLLCEPALAERLSRNARHKTEGFDWSVVLPQWQTLLTTAAQSRRISTAKIEDAKGESRS